MRRQSRALEKHRAARPAARRRSGIPPSRSWSARSAAPSRRSRSIARPARWSRSSISSRRCASCPTTRAAGRPSSARVQCQSCKAVIGLRSRARRAELRVLRLAGAGRLHGDQGADPAAEPAAVQGHASRRCASRFARWYASKWLAPGALKTPRARRSRPRRLHPVLDLRRAGRLPVDGRGGPLLLHDRDLPGQQGRTADAPGAARPLGAGVGEVEHFFDDEPVPGTQGVSHGAAEAGRAVSDHRAGAVRHRVPVRLRRRALPGRAARRRAALAGGDDAASCTRCAPARFPATPTATCRSTRRSRPDLQAHPRAGLAADVHLRRTSLPGAWSTATPAAMAGEYPKSAWKIALLVLLALIVLLIVILANQN